MIDGTKVEFAGEYDMRFHATAHDCLQPTANPTQRPNSSAVRFRGRVTSSLTHFRRDLPKKLEHDVEALIKHVASRSASDSTTMNCIILSLSRPLSY